MELSPRQKEILKIVKKEEPITSHRLAERLNITRSALRPDLSLLTLAQILHAKPRVGYFYNPVGGRILLQNLLFETKVADLQSVPIAVNEATNIYNAAITMFLEDTESLFIVDRNGEIKGYVTGKDLMKIMLGEADISSLPVDVAMVRINKNQCLEVTATLFEGLHMLKEGGVDAVAVTEGGKLTGRITRKDVIGFLLEKMQIKGGE